MAAGMIASRQRLCTVLLRIYSIGLLLYPADFREHYGDEMLHCAGRMLGEKGHASRNFVVLMKDLSSSWLWEHINMTTNRLPQLAMLLVVTTFIAGTGYVISQQVLRMSANDPQIQMAEDGATRMSSGAPPETILPGQVVEMSASVAPFVMVYDNQGNLIASSGRLDGAVPKPPHGVFDFVGKKGEERVTWQPRPGVRIASVITQSDKGFVLAGRNMREVEQRERVVFNLAAIGWVAVNLVLTAMWLAGGMMGTSAPPLPKTA
jgi:hypothetical protein